MSAHTPGPWSLRKAWSEDEFELDVFPINQKCEYPFIPGSIARVDDSRDEAEANARLIAAAPDLLAALKGFLTAEMRWETAVQTSDQSDIRDATDCLFDAKEVMRAAIAKAEGRGA